MAVVYYKFKSAKDFHCVPINDRFITVSDFKSEIFASKRYGNGKDFDLLISDAQTDEQLPNGDSLILANSSLLIRRIPGLPSLPIVIGRENPKIENNVKDIQEEEESFDSHDFGLDFNSILKNSTENPSNTHCKEDKIDGGKSQIPAQGYVCRRCKVAGHYIQHCPTNGDPNFDFKRVKPAIGISKTSVSTSNSCGISYASASTSSSCSSVGKKIAPELYCPLCKNLMKDGALTKCCFASFCDKCIRDRIVSKSVCVCQRKIVADDLLPNITLRETINRILNLNQTGDTASGNAGSEAANMKRKHLLAENERQQKKVDLGEAELRRKRKAGTYLQWRQWEQLPLLKGQ